MRTFCNRGDLQICDLWTQYFLKFADILFAVFLLTNTYLKCSNLNFYKIKDLAKQISSQLLDCFAIKGGKNVSFSLSYGGKFAEVGGPQKSSANSKSMNLQTYKICNFCGRSASVVICDLRTKYFLRLLICDLRSQIFCGLKTYTNLLILYFSPYKYIPKMF